MEDNENPPAAPVALTYGAFTARIKRRDDQQFAYPNAALEGFDDLLLSQKYTVIDTVSFCLTLARVLRLLMAKTAPTSDQLEALTDTARTFAPLTAGQTPLPPFTTLVRRTGNLNTFKAKVTEEAATTCTKDWGPPAGAVKDLLSPACMLLYVWFGRTYANPILDFVYAMCAEQQEWPRAWLECAAKYTKTSNAELDHDLQAAEALSNRTRGFANQAAVVVHLASKALHILERLGEGIFQAPTFLLNISSDELLACIFRASPADVAAAAARQYTTLIQHNQVLTPLPTQSSLPSYEPNFVDETNAQWFRTAQYHFSSLKFPQDALERGDATAERVWHQYVCEVRHARSLCLNLSEAQVIRHLSMSFTRSAMHYQTSIEKAQTPNCTVTDWLDAIRDFFFTNGLFRHHIEQAWQTYKAGQASDFNDLVHHIRTYYQLIFLDYPKLSGDMSIQDFAWHLFEKMQYLMSQTCKSPLGVTLQMYIPHSDLLKQMHLHLSHAHAKSNDKASAAGVSFIVWCIEQLHVAKASANAAQRYSSASYLPAPGVDYAALVHKPALPATRQPWKRLKINDQPVPPPAPRNTQPRVALVNISDDRGRDQPPQFVQNPTASPSRKPHNPFPDLVQISLCGDERRQRAYLERAFQHSLVPPFLREAYVFEKNNECQPGTLAHLGSLLRLKYFVPATSIAVAFFLLRSYFLHSVRMCWVCPHVKGGNPADRQHAAIDCPVVIAQLRQANIDIAPIAAAMNRNKAFYAHDPATQPAAAPQPSHRNTSGNPGSSRKRYGSQPQQHQPAGPSRSRSPGGPSSRSNIR